MNQKLKFLFVAFIFMTMLIPMISGAFNVDVSNNNTLSSIAVPNIIEDEKINMQFSSQFDDYYNQNFALRSLFISLYHKVSISLFNETSNDQVILGEENMLYFKETLDDYQRTKTLTNKEVLRLNEVFRLLNSSLSNTDTTLHFLIAPNKSTIYPEYMPERYTVLDSDENLEKVQSMITSIPLIDVKSVLLDYKEVYSELLYHKKDSHWNNLGAYVAYVQIMKAIGEDYLSFDLFDLTSTNNWKGDLSAMLFPAFKHNDIQYDLQLPETFTFTRPIRQLDDVQIESVNPLGSNSLMMYRDSFANALIPYLSQSFNQSSYYRNFPYDFSFLNNSDPDHLVLEIAERNIAWLLQATPVVESFPFRHTIRSDKRINLNHVFTSTKQSNQTFINAYFIDQEEAEAITAVKLANNELEIDVFPIYQDSDYQDNDIMVGFSGYVNHAFDISEFDVYVLMDDTWYFVSGE